MKKTKTKGGYTLIELSIVTTCTIVITVAFFSFQQNLSQGADLSTKTNEIVQSLRLSQANAIASEHGSQWGVNFETDNFTIFKGANYISRDPAFDEITQLPNNLSISNINLNGGDPDITFKKVSGETNDNGSIQISDSKRTKSISINPKGVIEQNAL